MAKKQEAKINEALEVIKDVEIITPALNANVELAKQKILDHLHGKVKVDLQEIYNLL